MKTRKVLYLERNAGRSLIGCIMTLNLMPPTMVLIIQIVILNTHNAVDDILRAIPLKRYVPLMLPARQGCVYTWRDGETISGITSTQ